MNESQTTVELTESLKRMTDTSSRKEQTQESTTECESCDHFTVCMERRGRCRSYTNQEIRYYMKTKKAGEDIENLNRSRAENA